MIWEHVRVFQKGGGTVCLTTHYMEEAAALCDRVAIMDHGKLIRLGSPAELIGALGAGTLVELDLEREVARSELEGIAGVGRIDVSGLRASLGLSDQGAGVTDLVAELGRRGIGVRSLSARQPTLEDVFIDATGRHLRDE
jgi:ABC-2 type transport system ATP-binding protein